MASVAYSSKLRYRIVRLLNVRARIIVPFPLVLELISL